jgi:hypothetical protein
LTFAIVSSCFPEVYRSPAKKTFIIGLTNGGGNIYAEE